MILQLIFWKEKTNQEKASISGGFFVHFRNCFRNVFAIFIDSKNKKPVSS